MRIHASRFATRTPPRRPVVRLFLELFEERLPPGDVLGLSNPLAASPLLVEAALRDQPSAFCGQGTSLRAPLAVSLGDTDPLGTSTLAHAGVRLLDPSHGDATVNNAGDSQGVRDLFDGVVREAWFGLPLTLPLGLNATDETLTRQGRGRTGVLGDSAIPGTAVVHYPGATDGSHVPGQLPVSQNPKSSAMRAATSGSEATGEALWFAALVAAGSGRLASQQVTLADAGKKEPASDGQGDGITGGTGGNGDPSIQGWPVDDSPPAMPPVDEDDDCDEWSKERCPEDCSDRASSPASGSGVPGLSPADQFSEGPVHYHHGTVRLTTTDLKSEGLGDDWGITRSWANLRGFVPTDFVGRYLGAFGSGMVVSELPYVFGSVSYQTMVLVTSGTTARYFDGLDTPGPRARFFVQDSLVRREGEIIWTDPAGNQTFFYDLTNWQQEPRWGKFKKRISTAGVVTEVTSWTSDGRPGEIERRSLLGQNPRIVESYVFTYVTAGVNQGLTSGITLRRQVNGGKWEAVRQVQYAYYEQGESFGNTRDLKTATIKDGAGITLDTKYYRYYADQGGFRGLKFYLSPQSFARLQATVADPFRATDAQVAPFADYEFAYHSNRRIARETVQATGCSQTTGGRGTYTFDYWSPGWFGDGHERWYTLTTETLPDHSATVASRHLVFTNVFGQVMLKVYESGAPANPQRWLTYYRYDSAGRLVLKAYPSAVTGWDYQRADLLDNVNGNYRFLRDNEGRIETSEYYSTTTATESTPGGIDGYFKASRVQQGERGELALLESREYSRRTSGLTANVGVTTAGGTTAESPVSQFAFAAAARPVIGAVGPAIGLIQGGYDVRIVGENLNNIWRVRFGELDSFIINLLSPNELTVRVPAVPSARIVSVVAYGPGGGSELSAAAQFRYVLPPLSPSNDVTVTGLSLNRMPFTSVVGTTILGTAFTPGAQVLFGSVRAESVFFISNTALRVTVPRQTPREVDVRVITPGGTSPITPAGRFTYESLPRPTITGMSASSGVHLGGYDITVVGSGFTGASQVLFGDDPATSFRVENDREITVTVPGQPTGSVDVLVVAPGGISQPSPATRFTYVRPAAPVISAIGPNSTQILSPTEVRLIGTGFLGASEVLFGRQRVAFAIESDNAIRVAVPARPLSGVVDVTVTTPGGTSEVTQAGRFSYVTPDVPVVTRVGPATGAVGGGYEVSLIGENLDGTTQVTFGSALSNEITYRSSYEVRARVPAENPGTVDVTVTTPGGTSIPNQGSRFTYVNPPVPPDARLTVTGISPTMGSTVGGALMTIVGTRFINPTAVNFGAVSIRDFFRVSDQVIRVRTPASPLPGTVNITVTTGEGVSVVVPEGRFSYVLPPAPQITGVGPNIGLSTADTFVRLVGSGFGSATRLAIDGRELPFTRLSDYSITAVIPRQTAGTYDLTITGPGGTSTVTPASRFEARRPLQPVLTGISPNTGSSLGGYDVTLVGANFDGVSAVRFGEGVGQVQAFIGNRAIRVRVPRHALITTYPVASMTVHRNANGTGAQTTTFAQTWYTDRPTLQALTITRPPVTVAQNGPGTPEVESIVYDRYGYEQWRRDGDGYLHYTEHDPGTGAVVKAIRDVNTQLPKDFRDLPQGWATPPGGGAHLLARSEVDFLGRETARTDPNGVVTYTVYKDPNHEVRVYPGWLPKYGVPTGPTQVRREDRSRSPSYVETLTMSVPPELLGDRPNGQEPIGQVESLERTFTSPGGQVVERTAYVSLAGVTYSAAPYLGQRGTHYYSIQFQYDLHGRRERTQVETRTIYRTAYDGLGRPVGDWVGTNDTNWTVTSCVNPCNMVRVSENVYDNGGSGDSNLTRRTEFPQGGAAPRVTQFWFDWRNRLMAAKQGVQANESDGTNRMIFYREYDNLDQVVSEEHYTADTISVTVSNGVPVRPAANRLRAKTTFELDNQGQVFRTNVFGVNQSNGAVSPTALTTNVWFDQRGNVLKQAVPGGLVTKQRYDGAGRVTKEYATDGGGDTTWADAGNVNGDVVLTQTETTYDKNGNAILLTTRDRFHDEAGAGELATPRSSPRARVSYVAQYFDASNRLTDRVDFGTSGGQKFSRPAFPPAPTETELVTHFDYTAAGYRGLVTDPRGVPALQRYDMLGRLTETVEAFDGGKLTDSTNRTTRFTYDGMNHVLTRTAVMPGGQNQTTTYAYGVTGVVNSFDLLASVTYPDVGRPSTERYSYNALGEIVTKTDRNNSVHTYRYDVLGRVTADAVTQLGANVDGRVRRLETAYDTGGLPFLLTSYDAASAGNVLNQVRREFNGLQQLVTEYQAHGGPVSIDTTPKVRYAYSEMNTGANHSRLTGVSYPNGRVVSYAYAAGINDRISRLSALADGAVALEGYDYLGLGTVVCRARPEPGTELTYVKRVGEKDGEAGDQYRGLDRFGRIVDQRWMNSATGNPVDRFQYGYDASGNRQYKANLVEATFSELYHNDGPGYGYDTLNRLTNFFRGELNESRDSVAGNLRRMQEWGLDALGNWSRITTDWVDQTRTHNRQNQITSITDLATPSYDNNGNLTGDEEGRRLTFDAWNRLTLVQGNSGTVAYQYDALGQRIRSTEGAVTIDFFYSASWQVLEERVGAEVGSQYVWSPLYVDALVARDAGGQRLYVQQDANWNVTSISDASGAIQERYVYDAYGQASVLTPNWEDRGVSDYGWVHLHQGGRFDAVAGLYHFRHRDFSPNLGRWVQQDVWHYLGGSNLYRHLSANPQTRLDPMGLLDYLVFDGSRLKGYKGDEVILDVPATSGPYGKGALPNGLYLGDNLRDRSDKKAMNCPDGIGWSLDLEPLFKTDRDLLRIHPDGNVFGTEGCIGVNCSDHRKVRDSLRDYFGQNGFSWIFVLVEGDE